MENTVKRTKAQYFEEMRELVIENVDNADQRDEFVEFIDKQLETLQKRKESAAIRAQKKREDSDELMCQILRVLDGTELMIVDDIVAAIGGEISRNKVIARLGKLVKNGSVVKEAVKVDTARKMAYRLAGDEVETETEDVAAEVEE